MYLLYIFPLSSTHLWLHCSNFFTPSRKNYFVCAANREIGNRKNQRLNSTPMYMPYIFYNIKYKLWSSSLRHFHQFPVTSSPLRPYTPLSTLSLCSSINMTDQILHPQNTSVSRQRPNVNFQTNRNHSSHERMVELRQSHFVWPSTVCRTVLSAAAWNVTLNWREWHNLHSEFVFCRTRL
jgi:hypothetical protein